MWFTKSVKETIAELNTSATQGLTAQQAIDLLRTIGPNKLQAKKAKSVLSMAIAQLNDWLIYILFAAVIVTVFMGHYIDAVIILLVIVLNAAIGVYQEFKADRAIDALMNLSSPKALVKRDGHVSEIPSEKLVPGDLVILEAGRIVPADIRLVEAVNLQIEESALTGESVPQIKDPQIVLTNPKTPLGDQRNMAFMSSVITSGRGTGIVVATGMQTQMGKIAHSLDADAVVKTPLEVRLEELGKMLGKIALAVCAVIFFISWLQGRDLHQMFLTAVSLAVASIPEGLAAIVAVVLSAGVTQMSRDNAIIRRLPAVETLGSVNVICSDKTGTLTRNQMTVVRIFTADGFLDVPAPSSHISPSVTLLASGMALCNDATLDGDQTGDPTEVALLAMADHFIDRNKLTQKRISEKVFDSDRKMMSVMVSADNQLTVYTKGALASVFKVSSKVMTPGGEEPLTDEWRQKFSDAATQMSDNALRTLALAYKPVDAVSEDMESNLVLVGVVGMIDPPRDEVKPSIAIAANAGIKTVMITGDHKNTALAIARNLGIASHADQVMTGAALDDLTDDQLADEVNRYSVYARVTPEHKVRIVKALKARGNTVSMTGDGVNDAPSLNAADIGVAMGITGTDVAKDAAGMILTDDNFATIVRAVARGRNIYNNIKKAVVFLLTCNLGEVVAMVAALLLGWATPLLATQLLWINLITDSLPAIALGLDRGDPDVMRQKPRPANESLFAHGAGWSVVLGGYVIGAVTFAGFWYGYYANGYSPADANVPEEVLTNARTMAFMILVCAQLFYAFGLRSFRRLVFFGRPNFYLWGAVLLGLTLQLVIIFVGPLRDAFKLTLPNAVSWMVIAGLGLVPLVLHEIKKLFFSRYIS